MFKQRYVTLGVALCAALGVHAFVLFYAVQSSVLLVDTQPIQIDLLPQLSPMQEQVLKENIQQTTHMPVKARKAVPDKPVAPLTRLPAQAKSLPTPVAEPEKEKVKVAQTLLQMIPKPIQQSILAAIVYPRQAQRRGWEGNAKFSLDIQQEMIRKVTLLVSTGYKSLDNAAQRGIASIDSLPLSDGKHILPVSFHLQ